MRLINSFLRYYSLIAGLNEAVIYYLVSIQKWGFSRHAKADARFNP